LLIDNNAHSKLLTAGQGEGTCNEGRSAKANLIICTGPSAWDNERQMVGCYAYAGIS